MSTTDQVNSVDDTKDSVKGEKNSVSYETYLRVLNEAKKAKEENKLFKAEEEKRKEQSLKEQNEFKTLYESANAKFEAERLARVQLEESVNNGLKISAFEKAIGGKIKNSEYYQLIPFDKIPFNPETKKVDEEGAKLVASEFLKAHSSLVEFQTGKMPNVAGSGAKNLGDKNLETMTPEEMRIYIKNLASTGAI
jgi:hypothetical protein